MRSTRRRCYAGSRPCGRRRTFRGSGLHSALAQRPPGREHKGPRQTEEPDRTACSTSFRPRPLVRVGPVASGPAPSLTGRHPCVVSLFRASWLATHRRRAPARRAGRKEHHCARRTMGARAFIPMALAGAVLLTLAPGATPAVEAASPKTEAQQIIKIAMAQRGDPWRLRRAPARKAFDCSGLVIYSFTKAGDSEGHRQGQAALGAGAATATSRPRAWPSRSNPKPGDLVIWGGGTHVGIYIGKGKAISTLTSGVRVHGVHAVRATFTAYLHTGMSTKSTGRCHGRRAHERHPPEARKPGDTRTPAARSPCAARRYRAAPRWPTLARRHQARRRRHRQGRQRPLVAAGHGRRQDRLGRQLAGSLTSPSVIDDTAHARPGPDARAVRFGGWRAACYGDATQQRGGPPWIAPASRPGSTATSMRGDSAIRSPSATCSAPTCATRTDPFDEADRRPQRGHRVLARRPGCARLVAGRLRAVLAVDGDVFVAHGRTRYLTDDRREVDREFANVFVCRFDAEGRCREFTEYYMRRRPERRRGRPRRRPSADGRTLSRPRTRRASKAMR